MNDGIRYSSDVAFTPAVKAQQEKRGSRLHYARMEEGGAWETGISAELTEFIGAQTSFYFATASAEGQPYIQHRGGPPGFLRVLDARTLAFADFGGNRQYISVGNLSENPRAQLFLMDYAQRRRVKIWGTARVVEDDPALLASLRSEGYKARAERVIVFSVAAWDVNCQQHIPQKIDAAEMRAALEQRDRRIVELEAQLLELRSRR